jgi:hypothetical protein
MKFARMVSEVRATRLGGGARRGSPENRTALTLVTVTTLDALCRKFYLLDEEPRNVPTRMSEVRRKAFLNRIQG